MINKDVSKPHELKAIFEHEIGVYDDSVDTYIFINVNGKKSNETALERLYSIVTFYK